ncbi:MAG: hypothetical protein ACRC8S_09600 [Fimbriiglobus sp.]
MARMIIMFAALALLAGCSRPATPAKAPEPERMECELFRRTIQGRGDHTTSTTLVERAPGYTSEMNHCRIEQIDAGVNSDTSFWIDVSFVETRLNVDVYRVKYRVKSGTQDNSREFEFRYAGESKTVIDDGCGQLIIRPLTQRIQP